MRNCCGDQRELQSFSTEGDWPAFYNVEVLLEACSEK